MRSRFDELAALGAFFAVEFHDRERRPTPPWSGLAGSSAALGHRVHDVRASLARDSHRATDEVELRAAASVTHLGLVARLLSPSIGVSALGLDPVAYAAADVWWQDRLGGPFPLSVGASPDDVGVLGPDSALVAVSDAVARDFGVSGHVLWGNVGSAADGAVRSITAVRSDLAAAARLAADEVLADPRVDGGDLHAGPGFRRRSCCLYYRAVADRRAVCGDCVLAPLH